MSEIKYYSEEGLQKLKDELHHLIAFERPAAAADVRAGDPPDRAGAPVARRGQDEGDALGVAAVVTLPGEADLSAV